MFSRFRKSKLYLYDPASYSRALHFLDVFIETECKTKQDIQLSLKYFIEVIGRDIETAVQALHIYKEANYTVPIRAFPDYCHTDLSTSVCLVNEEITVPIDLSQNIVITEPWSMYNRLLPNLKNINQNEFVYDKTNHLSTYYPYMNICVVHNGYHSIACAKHFKKGIIQAAVYDVETAFKYIDTDGKKWIFKGGYKPPEDVKDFRFALLFKIASRLYKIENEM